MMRERQICLMIQSLKLYCSHSIISNCNDTLDLLKQEARLKLELYSRFGFIKMVSAFITNYARSHNFICVLRPLNNVRNVEITRYMIYRCMIHRIYYEI